MKPKTNLLVNIGRFPFNKNFGNSTCPADPIDSSHRACNYCFFVHVSRIQWSSIRDNNFVKYKGTFRSDRTGESGPPSRCVVPDIQVRPSRNGPFHLIFPEFWAEWRASIVCREIMAWNTYSLRTAGFLRLIIACFAVILLNTSPVLITELEEDTKKLSLSNTQTEISLLK